MQIWEISRNAIRPMKSILKKILCGAAEGTDNFSVWWRYKMKSHKYWSQGAFVCMIMAMVSGYNRKKGDNSHHFWAISACICMFLAIYSGHKMVSKKVRN